MSSSSSSSALTTKEQERDWSDLPLDITTNILNRIGVVDILENVQKVCTAWRKICKEPSMWRVIKISNNYWYIFNKWVCKQAVDRSQGQLVDFTILSCDEEFLSYVTNRSGKLRRLEIVSFNGDMFRSISEALTKLPLLEELNLYLTRVNMRKDFIETLGRSCPMIKTLKLNQTRCVDGIHGDDDEVAIAIGENLHELRHLELIGNYMSHEGLQAILDGCVCLETLDLRKCFHIDLERDKEKRCFEKIKSLKMPFDSLEGGPYSCIYEDVDYDSDEDYYYPDSPPEQFDGYFSP